MPISQVRDAFASCGHAFKRLIEQGFEDSSDGDGGMDVTYRLMSTLVAPGLNDSEVTLFPELQPFYDLSNEEDVTSLKSALQKGFNPATRVKRLKLARTLTVERRGFAPEGETLTREEMTNAGVSYPGDERLKREARSNRRKVSRSAAQKRRPHTPSNVSRGGYRKGVFPGTVDLTPQKLGCVLAIYRFCAEKGCKGASAGDTIKQIGATGKEAMTVRTTVHKLIHVGILTVGNGHYSLGNPGKKVVLRRWRMQQGLPEGLKFDKVYTIGEILAITG